MTSIDFAHPEKYVGAIFKNHSKPELNAYYLMVRMPLVNGSKFFLIGLRSTNVWSTFHPPWGVSSRTHWSLLPNNFMYTISCKGSFDPMYNPEYTAPPSTGIDMTIPTRVHHNFGTIYTYSKLVDQLRAFVYPVSKEKFSTALRGLGWLLDHDRLCPSVPTFNAAFYWNNTPEGYRFWEDISILCYDKKPSKDTKDTRELI